MNVLLANDTRRSVRGEHWGSWLTTTNLSMLLDRGGLRIVETLPLGRLQPDEEIWKRIESAGMLVINGEGSIHSRKASAVALLNALRTAWERNIPTWIVNHSCWNCDDLALLYRYADFIAVRDIASHGYLAQYGIASRLAADCCFLSNAARAQRRERLFVCSGLQRPEDDLIGRWADRLNCSEVVLCNGFYPRFKASGTV